MSETKNQEDLFMRKLRLLILLTGCAMVVRAAAPLQKDPENDRHQIGVQVPIWVRARGSFSGFQVTDFKANNGSGTVERSYVDGYNKLDATGNAVAPLPPARYAINRTSNFKFDSMTQVKNDSNPFDSELLDPNGGTLSLHSIAISGGEFSRDRDADLLPGIELFYRYEMLQKRKWSLDWELGAALQRFEWQITSPINADADVITDAFPLGGVILRPTSAGQEGVFDDATGRRPVIGSVPQRSVTKFPGVIVGNHQLNMEALFIRLGPVLSWEPSRRWHFDCLGGLSLAMARTEYSYVNRAVNEISVDGIPLPVARQTGNVNDSSVHPGFYSALRANYRLTERWSAQAEVRHIWQESIRLAAPLGSAEVNLSDSLAIVLGISRRF